MNKFLVWFLSFLFACQAAFAEEKEEIEFPEPSNWIETILFWILKNPSDFYSYFAMITVPLLMMAGVCAYIIIKDMDKQEAVSSLFLLTQKFLQLTSQKNKEKKRRILAKKRK
jgi:hypothetical protein